jgi:hypothetical protein
VGPGDRVPHRPRPAGAPTISQGNRARAAAAELAVSGLIGVRGIKDEIDISYDAVAPVDVTALVLLRARAIAGQPIEDSILLCARLPVTVEDRDRAARLGFDLAAPYCPFTAQLAGASALGHADLASRLRAAGAARVHRGRPGHRACPAPAQLESVHRRPAAAARPGPPDRPHPARSGSRPAAR